MRKADRPYKGKSSGEMFRETSPLEGSGKTRGGGAENGLLSRTKGNYVSREGILIQTKSIAEGDIRGNSLLNSLEKGGRK